MQKSAGRGLDGSPGPLPHIDAIQPLFGGEHDVQGVEPHVGGPAAEACDEMGAEAYATGDAVAFRSQPSLHTAAHEAAHVIQQRGGVQLQGGVGQSGDAYERHADAVADRVVQGQSVVGLLSRSPGGGRAATPVQRQDAAAISDPETTVVLEADD